MKIGVVWPWIHDTKNNNIGSKKKSCNEGEILFLLESVCLIKPPILFFFVPLTLYFEVKRKRIAANKIIILSKFVIQMTSVDKHVCGRVSIKSQRPSFYRYFETVTKKKVVRVQLEHRKTILRSSLRLLISFISTTIIILN